MIARSAPFPSAAHTAGQLTMNWQKAPKTKFAVGRHFELGGPGGCPRAGAEKGVDWMAVVSDAVGRSHDHEFLVHELLDAEFGKLAAIT